MEFLFRVYVIVSIFLVQLPYFRAQIFSLELFFNMLNLLVNISCLE